VPQLIVAPELNSGAVHEIDIHLVDVLVRAIAIFDDVLMPKVGVGGKEPHSESLPENMILLNRICCLAGRCTNMAKALARLAAGPAVFRADRDNAGLLLPRLRRSRSSSPVAVINSLSLEYP
jgi:hypothetical protein